MNALTVKPMEMFSTDFRIGDKLMMVTVNCREKTPQARNFAAFAAIRARDELHLKNDEITVLHPHENETVLMANGKAFFHAKYGNPYETSIPLHTEAIV